MQAIKIYKRLHIRLKLSPADLLIIFVCIIATQSGTGCAQRAIVLTPDDTAAFSSPPAGFNKKRENALWGKIDSIQYFSTTVGIKRKLLVYTPPGYSTNKKYAVLYLLHGIAGDEREWFENSSPEIVLDNLFNEKKMEPMVVIFPNGRAMADDRAGGNSFDRMKLLGFVNFEKDLLNDIIPFVEANYCVIKDRESRAIAGASMGGGQALNIGLRNLDKFAWVGAFSPGGSWPAEALIPDPAETARKLRLLYISGGDKDFLLFVAQDFHAYLKEKNMKHIYQVNPGEHSFSVWINDLYFFTQRLFR